MPFWFLSPVRNPATVSKGLPPAPPSILPYINLKFLNFMSFSLKRLQEAAKEINVVFNNEAINVKADKETLEAEITKAIALIYPEDEFTLPTQEILDSLNPNRPGRKVGMDKVEPVPSKPAKAVKIVKEEEEEKEDSPEEAEEIEEDDEEEVDLQALRDEVEDALDLEKLRDILEDQDIFDSLDAKVKNTKKTGVLREAMLDAIDAIIAEQDAEEEEDLDVQHTKPVKIAEEVVEEEETEEVPEIIPIKPKTKLEIADPDVEEDAHDEHTEHDIEENDAIYTEIGKKIVHAVFDIIVNALDPGSISPKKRGGTNLKKEGPGVINTIVKCIEDAGQKGITKKEILAKLLEVFPYKSAETMMGTVTVQVGHRINKERFPVEKMASGKYRKRIPKE
jgi:hypothetical protein